MYSVKTSINLCTHFMIDLIGGRFLQENKVSNNYRAFSLTWPVSMQIYCYKRKRVFIRKDFNSHRTGLGHQHGHRFIVLGYKYGCRDVM